MPIVATYLHKKTKNTLLFKLAIYNSNHYTIKALLNGGHTALNAVVNKKSIEKVIKVV